MNLIYKKADLSDIEILTKTRIDVLKSANKLADDVDMSLIEAESFQYYQKCFINDEHVAYLVYDDKTFAGCGGVSFYQVMPTYHNPSGYGAYIMNMYTRPEYRRKGIAIKTLDLLMKEIKERNITKISLEATSLGRPLYERYGFVAMNDEMEYI